MLSSHPRRPARAAGFTLIELLAVILIIGILMTFLVPKITSSVRQANVTACQANMGEIYKHLLIYDTKFGDLPKRGGAAFLGTLVHSGVMENTENNVKRLTCPGVKPSALGTAGMKPEEWFADLERVDGSYTAYAARDMQRHPLRQFPGSGKEPLVADDNDGGANHPDGSTVVLYADGSVRAFEQYTLELENVLEKGELLIVGPDSQVEELRKLSLN